MRVKLTLSDKAADQLGQSPEDAQDEFFRALRGMRSKPHLVVLGSKPIRDEPSFRMHRYFPFHDYIAVFAWDAAEPEMRITTIRRTR